MIVAEYHFGNCTVKIADDCIVSKEEQEKILKRIGARRKTENREEAEEAAE